MIGKTIQHYKIIDRIGAGGMGTVYKAEDTRLDRFVALKFLPSNLVHAGDEKKRFTHEAKAASALDHPNICTIYEIGETDDGQMFIAMAYYDGDPLTRKIDTGPLSVAESIDIVLPLAKALARAHESGIVHRDIKPANIMITSRSNVKLVDFGLAKLRGLSKLTQPGVTVGTAAYMAPEQAQGYEVDQRADIWSWGAVFYELVTGRAPFQSDYEAAIVYSILNEEPAPPTQLSPELPKKVQDVILKALQKDPNQRFQSMDEIIVELEALRKETAASSSGPEEIKISAFLAKPWVLVSALAVIMSVVAAGLFFYMKLKSAENLRTVIPRVENLVNAGDIYQAYQLAVSSESRLAGDSTFQRLIAEISDSLTIVTKPEGARVYLKQFLPNGGKATEKGEYIGETPIAGFRIPRIDHKAIIEKEGYDSIERMASSGYIRAELSTQHIHIEDSLQIVSNVPEEMVFIPGGDYSLVSYGRPTTAEVRLNHFFIDKFEVSNKKYKDFISAGGYLKQDYWKHPFVKDGKTISWDEAMHQFRDRTGLYGPRNWTNQEFPEGRDDHPVTDISWYEAAAYAEFVGMSLPTLYQWEKAAQNGIFTFLSDKIMPWGLAQLSASMENRANFSGRSTVPVDDNEFGISPFGCYNIAGNVKEWCMNRTTKGYLAAGGSWEDPAYLFGNFAYFSAFYSSRALGFRCVKMLDGVKPEAQGGMAIDLELRTPRYTPVDESTYENFLSFYQYDKKNDPASIVETVEAPDWTREKITFAGAAGERVIAYLYLPRNAAKPYQCINYVPHGDAFYGRSLAEITEQELTPHIKSGRAVFSVVPIGCTERETNQPWPGIRTVEYRELCVQHVTEWSRGLDFLATRDDIDMDKLVYLGTSWGASTNGLISAAVESRYRAVVLIAGAIELFDKDKLPVANPINFAPYIKAPKLLIQGRFDERFTLEAHARPLYNLFREPKEMVVVEWGHMPPLESRVPVINRFLDRILGQVEFKINEK